MEETAETAAKTDQPQGLSNPSLIIIRGLPGSGKSYLAAALQDFIGKDKVLQLDPDKIDKASQAYTAMSAALTTEGVEEKFHPHRFLRSHAYQAITAHKVIIWNQAFTLLGGFIRTIESLRTFAAEHDTQLPVLVVEVEVKPDTAKARIAQRAGEGGHDVPEEAFTRFINEYTSFADQGYRTITVRGDNDVAASVASVMDALGKMAR